MNVSVQEVSQHEAASFLWDALSVESANVLSNVDGGQFGRPLHIDGIINWFSSYESGKVVYGPARCFLLFLCDQLDKSQHSIPISHACLKLNHFHNESHAIRDLLAIVYTLPLYRGCGLATQLVNSICESSLNDSKVQSVDAYIADRNLQAHRMYKQCQFEPINEHIVNNHVDMTLWRRTRSANLPT